MKFKNILLIIILVFSFQLTPVSVNAALGIPCATSNVDPNVQKERIDEYQKQNPGATLEQATKATQMCNFNDIFRLINNGITFILTNLLLPIAIILITYAGFLFMTSGGNENKRSQAKTIFKNLFIGIAMILGAWLIVYLLFRAFGYDTSRGRAGLSDQTINWNSGNGSVSLPSVSNSQNNPSANSNRNLNTTQYVATMISNVANPQNTILTITISPKAASKMGIRVSCSSNNNVIEESTVSGESVILKDATTTKITLKLIEDTDYVCGLENDQGIIAFADETDKNVKTPLSPGSGRPAFQIASSSLINNETISVAYRNASDLDFDSAFLSCKDSTSGNFVIDQSGAMLDRSEGRDLRYLNYNLPPGFSGTLESNINLDCVLSTFKSEDNSLKENKNNFSLALNSTKSNTQLRSVFRIAEVNNRPNSVLVLFNGSTNINPNMDLVCMSIGSNHVMRTKVSFDPTQVGAVVGTVLPRPTDGTINSPISLPVVWNGYGLRPNSSYTCNLRGQTLKNVAGYDEQDIVDLQTTFALNTPDIPLIKNPESKLSYYVSVRQPQVLYTRYPLLRQTSLNPNSPYIAPSSFRQAIPDSMFVPVTNGGVVDNGRMNLSCTSIAGRGVGSAWVRTVAVSGDISYVKGLSMLYYGGESGYSSGPGFVIPITRDPASGFMHSSLYTCFVGFTVENIPQVRSFVAAIPLYVDPTEIGPVVLAAESINANTNWATFTIVASPRLENSVNYSCRNVNGSYSDAVYWPPQALGIRMPVAIPVSNTVPGLKPGLVYDCELNGTTFQKQKVNYQFKIRTP